MCINCGSDGIGRRDLMKFGAAAVIAIAAEARRRRHGLGVCSFYGATIEAHAAKCPDGRSRPRTRSLRSNGRRTLRDPSELCSTSILAQSRSEVAGGQAPWATIISCADSRVPPELIFGGHGVGELFVSRDAGNLVDTATLGTVEFGAAVLGSPLIVVLAHTACGAVKAACDVVTKNATFPGAIGQMIEPIIPAALAVRNDPGDFTNNAAKESAKRTAGRLTAASTLIADLVNTGKVKIVAAIYDLQTGVVTYLD